MVHMLGWKVRFNAKTVAKYCLMVMPLLVVMWKPFSKKSTGHGSLRNMVLFLRMFGTLALFPRIPKQVLKFSQGMCFYPRKIVEINAY